MSTEAGHEYDDIINLPRPVSERHARMSMHKRAAQFSPFAALVGYGDYLQDASRQTENDRELDETSKEALDRKLRYLAEHIGEQLNVIFRCFRPDDCRRTGKFLEFAGYVKKIDLYRRSVTMDSGEEFPIDSIREITGLE